MHLSKLMTPIIERNSESPLLERLTTFHKVVVSLPWMVKIVWQMIKIAIEKSKGIFTSENYLLNSIITMTDTLLSGQPRRLTCGPISGVLSGLRLTVGSGSISLKHKQADTLR